MEPALLVGRMKRAIKSPLRALRFFTAAPPKEQEWSIAIYNGASPLALGPPPGRVNPVLTKHDVSDVDSSFVADPFLVVTGHAWFMFFEVFNRTVQRGEIGLASSSDGRKWRYEGIVLREPFHLSYPYVFEWNGSFFMVPERCASRCIAIYKASLFPFTWRLETIILADTELVDPSLLQHGGKWWLFASAGATPTRTDALRLFYADRLMGQWTEHCESPVVKDDPAAVRPAGRVVDYDGALIRYAQDCSKTYGRQVYAFEVTHLTSDHYSERRLIPAPLLQPRRGWNEAGMHHVDAHRLPDGSWLAAVDGARWVPRDSSAYPRT